MQVQTPRQLPAGEASRKGAPSWLWTLDIPSVCPAFCPQLGKWNHVTGCGLVPVLHQLCAPVSGTATTRLVGLSPAA